jgi:hypothetical protein
LSYSCAEWRADIGAYIVGALDGRARAGVSRHLMACPGCRADYDDLVPLRGWLSQLTAADSSPDPGRTGRPPPPDATPVPQLPRIVQAGKKRGRRWLLPAGAGLVAGAAVAGLLAAGPPASTYQAVSSATGVTGHAELHPTPTGTEIDLTASGLPAGEPCILVAVARNGADIAGTWETTYDGSARIAGTSAFPASQLTALRIESDTGVLLLNIRVWP